MKPIIPTCYFCKKETPKEPDKEWSKWWECKDCDVHYYENDDGLLGITFYKDIGPKRYRLEILPKKPKTFLFQVSEPFSLLVETNSTMLVTPNTALAKIKHLLTFL